jgi:hypothetical protein
LEEQNDFEAFPIKGSKPKQNQAPKKGLSRALVIRIGEQRFFSAVMRPNPSTPVNPVKKPVHNHKQNDDCEKAGRGLHLERGNTFRKVADDADRDEPGDQCHEERHTCTYRNGTSVLLIASGHARRDRSEHKDAFESFAEHKNTNVHERDGWARVDPRRVWRTLRGNPLPDNHRDQENRGGKNTDSKRGTD